MTQRYHAALVKVCRREGRFSRDPLTHAGNTILDMANVAREALGLPAVGDIADTEEGLPPDDE